MCTSCHTNYKMYLSYDFKRARNHKLSKLLPSPSAQQPQLPDWLNHERSVCWLDRKENLKFSDQVEIWVQSRSYSHQELIAQFHCRPACPELWLAALPMGRESANKKQGFLLLPLLLCSSCYERWVRTDAWTLCSTYDLCTKWALIISVYEHLMRGLCYIL